MLPTRYGPHPDQTGDLFLPDGARAPLICLWHGGFWRMPYGRNQLDGMAQDLCRAGLAVWNLEYRRIGEGGTPWPATLEDAAAALAHVATLRTTVPELDPARLILMGHSAGGHLAFWAASRARARGMNVTAVIGLAPLLDLEAAAGANLGNGAVQAFLGGAPAEVPARYASSSPAALVPLGVRQWVIHGTLDTAVPVSQSEAYVVRAVAAGDEATCMALPGVDHMSLIDPGSAACQAVRRCVLAAAAEGRGE